MRTSSAERGEYHQILPPNTFAPEEGHQALDIAIIGAGIAGLVSAIGLAESGHNVEVFERSRFANEVGAAITTCPNSSRILQYYGFDPDRAGGMAFDALHFMNGQSGEIIERHPFADYQKLYGAPWLLYHRVDLHKELKNLAFETGANSSRVAKLHLSSPIQEIGLDGTLILPNGEKVKKDLVVVADGVHVTMASPAFDLINDSGLVEQIRCASSRSARQVGFLRNGRFPFPHSDPEVD
ncbi:hypothetical protein MMC13_001249 [Lambiella insularis]|nr:hypothetical protein [Lambiella insularis]